MKIVVVGGTAGLGGGLAMRLAKAGHDITIGSRTEEKASAAALAISERIDGVSVTGAENAAAVEGAEVVIVAVPYPGLAPIYNHIKASLPPGCTVIDCTVPLASEIGGRPTRLIGVWEGSAAQLARSILPKHVHLASGFHTVTSSRLDNIEEPLGQDVLVCGEADGRAVAQQIVEAIEGARFIDCGPLETARILESLTALLIRININYKLDPGAGISITF